MFFYEVFELAGQLRNTESDISSFVQRFLPVTCRFLSGVFISLQQSYKIYNLCGDRQFKTLKNFVDCPMHEDQPSSLNFIDAVCSDMLYFQYVSHFLLIWTLFLASTVSKICQKVCVNASCCWRRETGCIVLQQRQVTLWAHSHMLSHAVSFFKRRGCCRAVPRLRRTDHHSI